MPIKKNVNQDFFKKWSREMAYVLGFFAADGNMSLTKRYARYISFYSSDKSILEDIQTVMGSNHKLSKRNFNSSGVFRFQIGSRSMFEDLVRLGFTGNKTSRMLMPNIPGKLLGHFIRGYFDGDGNIWIGYINKNRRTPTYVMQVTFTSGSHEFLSGLLSALREVGVKGGSLFRSKKKNFSRLTFSTLDAFKLEEIMYNRSPKLFLKRKKLRFEQFKRKYAVVRGILPPRHSGLE